MTNSLLFGPRGSECLCTNDPPKMRMNKKEKEKERREGERDRNGEEGKKEDRIGPGGRETTDIGLRLHSGASAEAAPVAAEAPCVETV